MKVSRRTFLKGSGAAAAGTLIAGVAAGAASSLSGCSTTTSQTAGAPLMLDDSHGVSVMDAYTYQDSASGISKVGEWNVAPGTVLYPAEGNWLPALTPAEVSGNMVAISAFSLAAANLVKVLNAPVNPDRVIYTVRATDTLFAWIELNVTTRDWTLYCQEFRSGSLAGTRFELYSADANWEPAQYTCSQNNVYFIVIPAASGQKTKESSVCFAYTLADTAQDGSAQLRRVVESHGRFGCAPAVSDGMLLLSPRRDARSISYEAAVYDTRDLHLQNTLAFPAPVKPFSLTTIGEHLVFQIEANYSGAGLLGKMGTFVQVAHDEFIDVLREPLVAPAGYKNYCIVKSQASYILFNTQDETYTTIAKANGSYDYGEYPLRVGTSKDFITYSAIKNKQTGEPDSVKIQRYQFAE